MKTKTIITFLSVLIILVFTNKVRAITIVLDPGHGGKDSGAINSAQNLYEKDVNFKTAKYLKQYLEEYENTKIIMTRNNDTFIEIYDRAIIGRNNNADLFVSLHQNSSTSTTSKGAEVYVTANKSLDKYNKEMTILGNKVLNNLNKIGIENRGVRTRIITNDSSDIYSDGSIADYYGVIRYSMRGTKIDFGVKTPENVENAIIEKGEGVPAILIEHCYINSSDYKFLDSDEDIQKLAKADSEAIAEYYNLKKKSNTKDNFKITNNKIITEPDITIQKIKEKYKEAKIITNEEKIVTGTKIDINNKEYTIIKLGDCSGDGEITPADYVKIKNHIMQVRELKEENKMAADVNEDNNITPADYVKVKNYIMNVSKIEIK